jgi:hypothetical protein
MGMKTQTVKVNGLTHQVRRVPCGSADHCKTCKEQGGHLAVYQDGGMLDGKRQWKYVGKRLPDADPHFQPATCQHEGCTNPTPRHNQKYCSARCRVAANREKK